MNNEIVKRILNNKMSIPQIFEVSNPYFFLSPSRVKRPAAPHLVSAQLSRVSIFRSSRDGFRNK